LKSSFDQFNQNSNDQRRFAATKKPATVAAAHTAAPTPIAAKFHLTDLLLPASPIAGRRSGRSTGCRRCSAAKPAAKQSAALASGQPAGVSGPGQHALIAKAVGWAAGARSLNSRGGGGCCRWLSSRSYRGFGRGGISGSVSSRGFSVVGQIGQYRQIVSSGRRSPSSQLRHAGIPPGPPVQLPHGLQNAPTNADLSDADFFKRRVCRRQQVNKSQTTAGTTKKDRQVKSAMSYGQQSSSTNTSMSSSREPTRTQLTTEQNEESLKEFKDRLDSTIQQLAGLATLLSGSEVATGPAADTATNTGGRRRRQVPCNSSNRGDSLTQQPPPTKPVETGTPPCCVCRCHGESAAAGACQMDDAATTSETVKSLPMRQANAQLASRNATQKQQQQQEQQQQQQQKKKTALARKDPGPEVRSQEAQQQSNVIRFLWFDPVRRRYASRQAELICAKSVRRLHLCVHFFRVCGEDLLLLEKDCGDGLAFLDVDSTVAFEGLSVEKVLRLQKLGCQLQPEDLSREFAVEKGSSKYYVVPVEADVAAGDWRLCSGAAAQARLESLRRMLEQRGTRRDVRIELVNCGRGWNVINTRMAKTAVLHRVRRRRSFRDVSCLTTLAVWFPTCARIRGVAAGLPALPFALPRTYLTAGCLLDRRRASHKRGTVSLRRPGLSKRTVAVTPAGPAHHPCQVVQVRTWCFVDCLLADAGVSYLVVQFGGFIVGAGRADAGGNFTDTSLAVAVARQRDGQLAYGTVDEAGHPWIAGRCAPVRSGRQRIDPGAIGQEASDNPRIIESSSQVQSHSSLCRLPLPQAAIRLVVPSAETRSARAPLSIKAATISMLHRSAASIRGVQPFFNGALMSNRRSQTVKQFVQLLAKLTATDGLLELQLSQGTSLLRLPLAPAATAD
uniref:3'-5' exonuclease domain-containing protein n=1 Tax=Macrostomum lignano TaxID=282301 RepID=A0A1I8I726_9PLAT